jgi:hypothetical protein
MEKNVSKKKKDKDANEFSFKLEYEDLTEMLKNAFEGNESRNGVCLYNFQVQGVGTDELIDCLFQFLHKNQIEFMILDLFKDKEQDTKYTQSKDLQNSNINLEENRNIEKIFAVMERLELDKELRTLIQERINDPVSGSIVQDEDSLRPILVQMLKAKVNQQYESKVDEEGNNILLLIMKPSTVN